MDRAARQSLHQLPITPCHLDDTMRQSDGHKRHPEIRKNSPDLHDLAHSLLVESEERELVLFQRHIKGALNVADEFLP